MEARASLALRKLNHLVGQVVGSATLMDQVKLKSAGGRASGSADFLAYAQRPPRESNPSNIPKQATKLTPQHTQAANPLHTQRH